MILKLIALAGEKLSQEVYEVIIPTVDGEIAVFPSHEPLITVVRPGVVTVKYGKDYGDDRSEYYAISGGVVEINGDLVKMLVDEADHGDEIIESETKAALDRAIKMRDEAVDQIEIEKAHQLVDRHIVRLKVAELHRKRRRL